MAIRIITDSTSDLTPAKAQQLGVHVMPLKVIFGEDEYLDGVTLTAERFFELLSQSETLPRTCQVTPEAFEEQFREAIKAGNEVIVITIASLMSGTCQSALIAKDLLQAEGVYVIDSETVTFGLRNLVMLAVKLREEGKAAQEIAAVLEEKKKKLHLYAVIDTLKYLKMGGRLSSTAAIAGSLLGIKPIISVGKGRIDVVEKARGAKKAYEQLLQLVKKEEIDFSLPLCFGHTNAPDMGKELMQCCEPLLKQGGDYPLCEIGSTVGTHVGPGCTGISYFVK